MELVTEGPAETQKFGKKFAASLVEGGKTFITLALVGDLGSGKTTFVQGFAEGLGINQRVISPTFILMRKYQATLSGKPGGFYHIDLYRITDSPHEEARNLGLFDIWSTEGNVMVIEWGEKLKDLLPKDTYWIEFSNLGGDRRKIRVREMSEIGQ